LGSVKPVLLHGMMIVLLFITHVCLSARGNTLLGQLVGYEQLPGAAAAADMTSVLAPPAGVASAWRERAENATSMAMGAMAERIAKDVQVCRPSDPLALTNSKITREST
jgi:hypothetical protein